MLRLLAILVAWLILPAPAQDSPHQRPGSDRLILYLDAESPAVRVSIAKFEAALARRGITARHRVTVRHLPVNVFDRKDALARIVVALRARPAAIIATSSESAGIARDATSEVPIIFGSYQDPVELGLVRSLAQPGGNLTGFTIFAPIDLKRLELLREIAPSARRLGIVVDHWWMAETNGEAIVRAAEANLGFRCRVFLMERPDQLAQLDSAAAREIDAWYVPPTTLPFEHPAELTAAMRAVHRPVIFSAVRHVDAGGLIAYQPRQTLEDALDLFAKLAGLVLDGVPAGTIPVERPKAFELAINAAEARRLGIRIPEALLKRADRVVDTAGEPSPQ